MSEIVSALGVCMRAAIVFRFLQAVEMLRMVGGHHHHHQLGCGLLGES